MIRQRFNSGRLTRIGAWALAAITSVAAILNHQAAAADEEAGSPPDGVPVADQFASVMAPVPAAPADGLLIIRYAPNPPPPPPTIIRRVIVEEGVAGSAGSTGTAAPSANRPASSAAPAANPTPPPPAPAALPPPPPVQSAGS